MKIVTTYIPEIGDRVYIEELSKFVSLRREDRDSWNDRFFVVEDDYYLYPEAIYYDGNDLAAKELGKEDYVP